MGGELEAGSGEVWCLALGLNAAAMAAVKEGIGGWGVPGVWEGGVAWRGVEIRTFDARCPVARGETMPQDLDAVPRGPPGREDARDEAPAFDDARMSI